MPDNDLTPEGAQRRAQARQQRLAATADIRVLVQRSSLGTPGAVALRKRASGQALTEDEHRAADEELASLEADLELWRQEGGDGG